MKRLSIGYIVDHPRRDLPGAVQFARALLKYQSDTYLIPLYEQAVDVPLLPLDGIIINFARPANLDLVRGYRAMGLPVFVLDTEGGNQTVAGSNTPDRLAALLKERGFSRLLSGYFFWGPALRQEFVAGSGMSPDRLLTTGCPRFDYASPRWRAALAQSDKDYVLINANFPLVNPRFGSEAAERAAMISAGWDRGYVDRLMQELKKTIGAFTETVARLANDLPQMRFVLRPHPFEDLSFYAERLKSTPNVEIRATGDVLTVLANASCLIHLNCATAIEAIMLERLPISLEWLNTPSLVNHAPLPSRVSKHATSYQDALDVVSNVGRSAEHFDFRQRYDEFIFPWFYRNDGCAADRMVETLIACVEPRENSRYILRSMRASREEAKAVHYIQGLIATSCGSLAYSRVRSWLNPKRRDKSFHLCDVARALKVLCEIERREPPRIQRATHPVTGLPLASIECRAPDMRPV